MNSHYLLPSAVSGCPDRGRPQLRPVAMRPVRTLFSGTILEGETEIAIDHHGELYRLKVTRQGKLILTK